LLVSTHRPSPLERMFEKHLPNTRVARAAAPSFRVVAISKIAYERVKHGRSVTPETAAGCRVRADR
jgi:hypothetical protein